MNMAVRGSMVTGGWGGGGRVSTKVGFLLSTKSKFRRNCILISSKFRRFDFPKFRFRFRCRNRNFEFGYDFDYLLPTKFHSVFVEFRCQNRNFDFGFDIEIGILISGSISTSEFRFRYKISIQMLKLKSIFQRSKSILF
jgi:hypothetical protein